MKCFIYDTSAWGFSRGVNCRKVGSASTLMEAELRRFSSRRDRNVGQAIQKFSTLSPCKRSRERERGKFDNSPQMPTIADVRRRL